MEEETVQTYSELPLLGSLSRSRPITFQKMRQRNCLFHARPGVSKIVSLENKYSLSKATTPECITRSVSDRPLQRGQVIRP